MNWSSYILRDQKILGGKPVIRGTRISVKLILEHLSGGWTEEQLLENYPTLSRDHIAAALAYAADAIDEDEVIFLERLGS